MKKQFSLSQHMCVWYSGILWGSHQCVWGSNHDWCREFFMKHYMLFWGVLANHLRACPLDPLQQSGNQSCWLFGPLLGRSRMEHLHIPLKGKHICVYTCVQDYLLWGTQWGLILKYPKSGPNGKEDTVRGAVKGTISGGWSLFPKRSIAVQLEHIKEFLLWCGCHQDI